MNRTKKRILLVSLSDHTNFQDEIFSMYECLKTDHEVTTLTMKETTYPVSHDEENLFVSAPKRPGIAKGTFNIFNIRKMIKMIKQREYDVVFFDSFHVWNYPIMLYCSLKKISIAHAINDAIPHKGDTLISIKKWLNSVTAKWADLVVLRSENELNMAKEVFPRFADKMTKVDLWYSYPAYRQTEGSYVLFFGRIHRYKGVEKLLELIRLTPDIQYMIVGRSAENVQETVAEIDRQPNAQVVDRTVTYEEMHEYFYSCSCVVMPYESASQSGIVLEANRHSKPSVAFNVGALSEQIDEGKTGYLIEPGNVEEMAARIRDIIGLDAESYKKMCRNSYDWGLKTSSAQSRTGEFLSAIGIREDEE